MVDNLQLGGMFVGITLLISAWYGYETKIDNLEKTVKELREEIGIKESALITEKHNYVTIEAALKDANAAVEKLGVKYGSAMVQLEAERNKPKDVKYEVIYKYIDKEDSNECEDIKYAIDGLANYINHRMR